ncbi:head morphogenesis protein [Rhizobium sp. rho-13.1]|uniref:head morphogenesis protein n=1 Tax=Rhizobium sp. rho-13.1 TaxID=2506431 RepID=UPI00115D2247|nr:head morphogenesis protein [Rhizobium sp. rho-13.1]TQX91315.1 head morphogenesis protein [Rhizobium sp. rho-13.1]
MATLRQQLNDLIDKLTPDMEKAFHAAVDDLKSEVVIKEVVAKLEQNDVAGALSALHIDPTAFQPLADAMRAAYGSGGSLVAQALPQLFTPDGTRVVFRWDVSNQAAEANIRDLSSKLITNISGGTVQAVQQAIVNGYAQGQGPAAIALDLVGRRNNVTGKREGGIIGLNGPQSELIARTQINLASGDPVLMKKYLDLNTRDKRFDGAVKKAIAAGKPLDAATATKVLARLRDKNLKLRGDTIARTETVTAVLTAKHDAYRQALAKANRDETLVKRKWRSSGKITVRHTHQILNGQEVVGMDLPFVSVSGAMLRYPGDVGLGAPVSEIVNCECDVDYVFDFAEAFARSKGR